jgi:thiamine pyrophosphate-dependent acetolactate synthase large subunit-like protein
MAIDEQHTYTEAVIEPSQPEPEAPAEPQHEQQEPAAPGPVAPTLSVADIVGQTVAALGVTDVFGLLGSGNLVMTNAACRGGARFHAARHEGGALAMADGYARVSGRVGVCSVHQGPGLTNTMTALAEAAKSRTPLLVLAGETPAAALTSNFRIDQHGLVESVGAIAERVHSAATAADDVQRAYQRAVVERRPVVLMVAIDIAPQPAVQTEPSRAPLAPLHAPEPPYDAVEAAATILQGAERPAIIAGRGAISPAAAFEIERLGARIGALLATSAPANGLFAGNPFALGIAGGFACAYAAEMLAAADVVVVFGASINHWTTRSGALIAPDAKVVQVDIDPRAIARNHRVDAAMIGDAAAAARLLTGELEWRGHRSEGVRSPHIATLIAGRRWADEPYEDASTADTIDPRTLSIELERRLPADKAVAVDSGHFLGYPSMFLSVQDPHDWVFANGFQAVGLGLGTAIGAAVARPDRPTVAAIGDGGAFLALAELETAARLGVRLLVLIYDDRAYGAEVHHFAPIGHDVAGVRFPDADLAAIARAAGAQAMTVRTTADLDPVAQWLKETAPGPLVLDAKVNPEICAEWLSEAFRNG